MAVAFSIVLKERLYQMAFENYVGINKFLLVVSFSQRIVAVFAKCNENVVYYSYLIHVVGGKIAFMHSSESLTSGISFQLSIVDTER